MAHSVQFKAPFLPIVSQVYVRNSGVDVGGSINKFFLGVFWWSNRCNLGTCRQLNITVGVVNQAIFGENFIEESLVNDPILYSGIDSEYIAVKATTMTMNALSV